MLRIREPGSIPIEPEPLLSVDAIEAAMLACRRPARPGALPSVVAAAATAANPDGVIVRSLLLLCRLRVSRARGGSS